MKKTLTALAMMAALAVSPIVAKELKIGTNPQYAPFEYKNEKNELVGFDIDVMNELCKVMERECTYVEQSFDSLIPQLRQRRFDLIISSMDITEARAKQVRFSDPYYLNYSIYIVKKENEDKIGDLNSEKVGVLSGSTHQEYVNANLKGANISSYPEYPSAINDLLIGRVNVVFGDGEVVYDYIKENDQLTVYGEKVTDAAYFGQGLGIAARQNDAATIEAVNAALKTVKENGRYDEIYKKWFGDR